MNNKIKKFLIQLMAIVSIGCLIIGIHKMGEYWLYDYLRMQADNHSNKWMKALILSSPLFVICMYIFILNAALYEVSKRNDRNEKI